MKKLFVLLILLLSFGRSQAADIEARTGILGGDGWGLQTGAYINFPQSRLFSIQTGLLLHTAGNSFSYVGVKNPFRHYPSGGHVIVRRPRLRVDKK